MVVPLPSSLCVAGLNDASEPTMHTAVALDVRREISHLPSLLGGQKPTSGFTSEVKNQQENVIYEILIWKIFKEILKGKYINILPVLNVPVQAWRILSLLCGHYHYPPQELTSSRRTRTPYPADDGSPVNP